MKLSQRLQHIEQMIPTRYQHIWDCCCDHGFLGAALLERQAAPYIHFVDIVPTLIADLTQRLEQFFPNSPSQWTTQCQDVTTLALSQYQGKQLVIIAGVGGDLMTDMVHALHQQFSHLDIDFLLCPVYQQFLLRDALIKMNMSLIEEKLVEDKGRFYEVMFVSQQAPVDSSNTISPAGHHIWQASDATQLAIANRYLNKTLTHYQRMQLNAPKQAKKALKHYQKLLTNNVMSEIETSKPT
ncbi:tRNA (adenine(22)-N(1))-methyltransferase [Vibrio gangliei]|uniref:tRNA (adenine(22)-N(1))-methyltransferase n=1 Tax=Vibrio gangliei TaxID=2077090 RepID=UPI000D01389F|nr:tRNA (adenine(22)-N(1))-methyltransferase TrmK [Vibrio gangliei]